MFAYLVFFGVDGEVPEWNLVNIETEWLERPLQKLYSFTFRYLK
jgi:hypothetical protein